MRLRHISTWALIALLGQFFVMHAAVAQTQEPQDELNVEEQLSLIDEDVEALTDDQKLERAAAKIEQMRQTVGSTQDLLESVRDGERDILKINCINEKLAAIKGFVKVSEESYVELKTAAEEGDPRATTHQYTLISVAHQRVGSLAGEARLCTGEERRFAGRSEIEVIQPRNGVEEVRPPEEDLIVEDLPELPELTPVR